MTQSTQPTIKKPPDGAPRTVAEALGQVAWLFSQSAIHKELRITGRRDKVHMAGHLATAHPAGAPN